MAHKFPILGVNLPHSPSIFCKTFSRVTCLLGLYRRAKFHRSALNTVAVVHEFPILGANSRPFPPSPLELLRNLWSSNFSLGLDHRAKFHRSSINRVAVVHKFQLLGPFWPPIWGTPSCLGDILSGVTGTMDIHYSCKFWSVAVALKFPIVGANSPPISTLPPRIYAKPSVK